jgi:hypothetical protein
VPKLVINIITRNRPHLIVETVENFLAQMTTADCGLMVSVDDDDVATIKALEPYCGRQRTHISIQPREDAIGDKWSRSFRSFPDAGAHMLAADYAICKTKGFDKKIIDAVELLPDNIGVIGGKFCNASFSAFQVVTRGLARRMGFVYPPYFPYWFVDHWVDDIARMIGRLVYVDVDIDAVSRKPPTQEMRDLVFWSTFFDLCRGRRHKCAERILDDSDTRVWLKSIMVGNFEITDVRSKWINDCVRASAAHVENAIGAGPPDERYLRSLDAAKAMIPELVQEMKDAGEDVSAWIPRMTTNVSPIRKSTGPQMKKILLFVPAFGQMMSCTTVSTIIQLMQVLPSKAIAGGFGTLSYPDIAEMRDAVLSRWYDHMTDYTHLLFIDADMGFAPELVLDMLLFDQPLVGAIYRKRIEPPQWAASGSGGPTTARTGDFIEVDGLGMGVCLIRRDVVTTMLEKMPELSDDKIAMLSIRDLMDPAATRIIRAFDPIQGPSGRVSEDLSFCQRWRECGGTVWGAIGHSVSHVGMYDFCGRYADVADKAPIVPPALQAAE